MTRQAPLLDVDPVALAPPPPASAAPKAPPLAGRALLLLALLLGIPVLGILLTAFFIALNVLVWRAGRVQLGLVIAAIAVPVALARAFIVMLRKPPASPDEVEIPEADEPGLHTEARRLAEQAGTGAPDRIVVIPDVNAYVHETGPLFGLVKGTRTLGIGAPLLDALTVTELRAVLGHEFGHFASGDTKLGPLAWRTEAALVEIVQRLGGFSGKVFVWYFKLQYRVGAAVRRGQELVADRAAVRIAGRQAAADALRKVQVAAVIDNVNMEGYLVPLLETGHRPPDMASGYRALLHEPARVAWASELQPDGDHDPYASHPPTAERIRRVEALPELSDGAASETDDRAAAALFADPDRWIRAAHENWLRVRAGGDRFETVDWDQWPELILLPEHRRLAGDTDNALAQLGFDGSLAGIRQAVDAGRARDLSAKLVHAGWRAGTSGISDDLLYAAVLAAVSVETTTRGTHRWALSWSGSAELQTVAGADVKVHDRVAAAVEGDWSAIDELLAGDAAGGESAPARRRTRRTRKAADSAEGAATATAETPQTSDVLPTPPSPPFEQTGDGEWRAELPAGRGRKKAVVVCADRIEWGKDTVPYDDIASIAFEINRAAATLGFKVVVKTSAGDNYKLQASGSTEATRALVAETYGFVLDLFTATVAPRRHQEIGEELRSGGTIVVAGLAMSAAGMVWKKTGLVAWRDIVGPYDAGPGEIGFSLGDQPIVVPLAAENAILLPGLIPYLRALLG